jgi:hypothetical protein
MKNADNFNSVTLAELIKNDMASLREFSIAGQNIVTAFS